MIELASQRCLIYIMSPYAIRNKDELTVEQKNALLAERVDSATLYAAHLARAGRRFFSPITMTHPVTKYGLPLEWEYWRTFDALYLEIATEGHCLQLDGWEESVGVQEELSYFKSARKPVVHITIGELEFIRSRVAGDDK